MGPSVFQIRAEDVLLDNLQGIVLAALKQHQEDLAIAALVVVDAAKSRVRVLPIGYLWHGIPGNYANRNHRSSGFC